MQNLKVAGHTEFTGREEGGYFEIAHCRVP